MACTDLFTGIGKKSFQDRETDATECVELEGVGVDSEAQGSASRLPLTIVALHHPETGVPTDFAEGSFLQSVLPTFGVGAELLGAVPRAESGLGRYAFARTAHMTEEHPLNTNASSQTLLSEWGANWDLTRPMLLEKTPTNSTAPAAKRF